MEINNQYLTYAEYIEFGGSLERTPFNILEYDARKEIDKYTFGRLQNLETQVDDVKMCCYKLINLFDGYTKKENGNKLISSESTDGYSVTYNNNIQSALEAKTSEIKDIIKKYLCNCKLEDGTPYLYVGVKVRYDYE